MPKRCSLYWSRHAVIYRCSCSHHAPSCAPLSPASASRCAALPEPAVHYPSEAGASYDGKPWVGRRDYQNKIKEHLLVRVCQLIQLKEQEENKACQEERELLFSPSEGVFSFPWRPCSVPAFQLWHPTSLTRTSQLKPSFYWQILAWRCFDYRHGINILNNVSLSFSHRNPSPSVSKWICFRLFSNAFWLEFN